MAKIKVSNVLFNILTIVTVAAVLFVAANALFGVKGYAVTSNSMADTFNKGDVVFSRAVSFDELKEGDVVTVSVDNSKGYFTHRIVAIDYDKRTVDTKGDNNNVKDPMSTSEKNIVGKMWYSVPLLGYISLALSGASMYKSLIILALIAIALIGANIITAKINKKKVGGDRNEQS